jgi:chitinase
MKDILQGLDTAKIRQECFVLFGLPANLTDQDLKKAYYTYMSDPNLVKEVTQLKQSHERYMVGIMTCDVFPGLDKQNPLSTTKEDVIPDKYGPKWYEAP